MNTLKRNLKVAVIALALSGAVPACSGGNQSLQLEPGPQGTFLAVGAEASLAVDGTSDNNGSFKYQIGGSKTSGISIGAAIDQSGKSITKNEQQLFVPASITKVVTAALALKHLGADFRFKTEVVWDLAAAGTAKDLTVFANGDPQVGTETSPDGTTYARLQEIAAELKKRGISKIVGSVQLVSVDARKDLAAPPDGMDAEDNLACYGARSQSFNYRRNCAGVLITGINQATWTDSSIRVPFRIELSSGDSRSVTVRPLFGELHQLIGYLVHGKWSNTGKPIATQLPVAETKSWFGNSLLTVFARNGIDIKEIQVSIADEQTSLRLYETKKSRGGSFQILSSPLADLVRFMCKPSDNFLADTLFKAIAVKDSAMDLREAGHAFVRRGVEEWMRNAGHPEYASEIELVDGAGLSRSNHVSARAFLTLLKEISKEPSFPALWNALPIAGVDGTLRGRMQGTAAMGVVRAKTGTLTGAYQLAGFIPVKDGYVPFVILSSAKNPQSRFQIHAFQDKVVASLASQLRGK